MAHDELAKLERHRQCAKDRMNSNLEELARSALDVIENAEAIHQRSSRNAIAHTAIEGPSGTGIVIDGLAGTLSKNVTTRMATACSMRRQPKAGHLPRISPSEAVHSMQQGGRHTLADTLRNE